MVTGAGREREGGRDMVMEPGRVAPTGMGGVQVLIIKHQIMKRF